MQLANCLVALGGDRGNAVPKAGVTAGEILALQAIHGPDAVFDIEPAGNDKDRTARGEVARLKTLYGGERDENGRSKIADLFPGAAATAPTSLKDLDLADELMKPKTRASVDEAGVAGAQSMAFKTRGGNTAYEPIEVTTDLDHTDEGGVVDPRTLPTVNQSPGVAAPPVGSRATKKAIEEKATKLAETSGVME
ncbi:MAG: hypothetical protein WAP03_19320 [Methylorubrum rhodinum]|uniref:hypothetical protein n=1 Tax=Methylorubrum rhodinum TaxID=29428 RepID=UPI003BB121EE